MLQSKKTAKGVVTGMLIGSVIGMTTAIFMRRPKQSKLQRTVHRTFCTLSTVMQSICDLTR